MQSENSSKTQRSRASKSPKVIPTHLQQSRPSDRRSGQKTLKADLPLRESVRAPHQGIIIYKLSGDCVFANAEAASMFGVGIDHILHGKLGSSQILTKHGLLPTVAAAISTNREQTNNITIALNGAGNRSYEVYVVPVTGKSELQVQVCIDDVTEHVHVEEVLRETERKMSTLLSNLPGIAYRCRNDREWTMEFISDGCMELTGYPSADLMFNNKLSYNNLIVPEDRDAVWQQVQTALTEERPYRLLYRIRTAHGTIKWVWEQGRGISRADGTLEALEGLITDVTERKLGEIALGESDAKYRALVEQAADGIFIVDQDGNLTLTNPQACQMLGYTETELRGMAITQTYPPENRHVEAPRRKSLRVGDTVEFERTMLRKDGSTIPVEVRLTMLESGGYQGIVRDITERKRVEEELRYERGLLRTLIDNLPDAIYVKDRDSRKTLANLTDVHNLGCDSEAEVLGKNDFDFFPADVASAFFADDRSVIESGRPVINREESYFDAKGQKRWLLTSKLPLRDDKGDNIGLVGIGRDITERKRAEEVVQDSEERFRMVFEHVFDGISIYSEDPDPSKRRLIECNERYAAMAGRTREELLRLGSTQGLQITLEDTANSRRLKSLNMGTAYQGSFSWVRPDGKENVIEYVGMPITWRGESYSIGIDRDVTERKQAEEDLRQSEEQFRLIAENVGDMIAVLDLEGRRIYNSPSYERILPDPLSLKGTDSFQEIHPEDVAKIKQVFQETVKTGVGQKMEYRLLGKDGSERTIDSKGGVIRDRDGKIFRVVVVSRDVTEEKRLAAQFMRAQRMESIGTLAGGIAHDLNNVLAPIMMAIEVLKSKISDPGAQKILNTIETSAMRGADIVRQVLAFGRGVKGERILVQLKHVVNEVVKIAGATFPKSIQIKTDIPRDLWTVSADATQMHQVLLNLLVNARDAMPRGGALSISAENIKLDENYSRMHFEAKPGSYVSIAITDTGTGIPADIREKIFDPFFTTKEIGLGTGLGLSTTHAIVKSHEGFINLSSEVGKGTTFSVYIPATGTGSRVAASDEEAELPMGNGELVLIIDDEAAIREITKETLEAYGYKTMTASDGADGVGVFAENKKNIKAVITDIMMPVMDGTAAIIALRKINPDVKIIAASGMGSKGQIKPPPRSSIQAFLSKPYTAEKLLKALAAVLR